MIHRQPSPPGLWLMTDERMGDALWPALARLPPRSGIVFRHYGTPEATRRVLYERVRAIARRRRLVLVLADRVPKAIGWRAHGVHGRKHPAAAKHLLHTAGAHDMGELMAATRAGADVVFLSPVFATRSHPGGHTMGAVRFGLLATTRSRTTRIIALGGMNQARFGRLRALGAWGWAAIDAWTGERPCRVGTQPNASLRT